METLSKKIIAISILLTTIIGFSCQKDEIDFANENIEVHSSPGLSVYKTQGDYLNYVTTMVNSSGVITMNYGYTKDDPRVLIDKKGKATFSNRWLLKCGYVVSNEMYVNHVFTNITLTEYVDYTSKNNSGSWTDELVKPRIIDENPFLSFYHLNGLDQVEETFTLGQLNDLIENGTIEDYFEKLK